MASFFDENERYTSTGLEDLSKADVQIKSIFCELIEKGYKIREISHVLSGSVKDAELMAILTGARKTSNG